MMSLWWLALPVLLLPIWWHRQKSARVDAQPLATARFLPRTEPLQQRRWRWVDRALLLVRLLLLIGVIAWLADLLLPWRGDTVLIVPGADSAWVAGQIKAAGFARAARVELPTAEAFAWFADRQREWRPEARVLVLGAVPMPASKPQFGRDLAIVAPPASPAPEQKVAVSVVSKRAAQWRALFAAVDGPRKYVVSDQPDAKAELIVWDVPHAPPAGLRAPLWWVGDASAFPELKSAQAVDGVRYAASARGRLWASETWPPRDAAVARSLLETWQKQHYGAPAWVTPSQLIPRAANAGQGYASGALHHLLAWLLMALFALERILAHARRR